MSSVGNLGGTYFVPTILKPQTAIMAIGQARKIAKYVGERDDGTHEFIPADQLTISISADHRILDGATVIRFSNTVKSYLENPDLMLLNL